MNNKKILVTGTLGFIFSNYVRQERKRNLVGLDKAVKSYNLDNMLDGMRFYFADLLDSHNLNNIFTVEKPDIVIGGAAESFVDNSITDVLPFLNSNIIGTQNLINMCLKHGVEKYVHISTDEVYGQVLSMTDRAWTENDPLRPRNPYSASKACAEHIVVAAHNTHGLQYQITRSCNVFGPRQKLENLVPHVITQVANGDPVRIHGNGSNFRQYIFVNDLIEAICTVVDKGAINTVYNIGAENFLTNLEMVQQIAAMINVPAQVTFIPDRKAHDFGYRVDSGRIRDLGWKPRTDFLDGLQQTINYYLQRNR